MTEKQIGITLASVDDALTPKNPFTSNTEPNIQLNIHDFQDKSDRTVFVYQPGLESDLGTVFEKPNRKVAEESATY